MNNRDIHLDPIAARRLSEILVRRRVELGFRSARKLGLETGLDYRTITSLEGARRDSVTRSTLATLELKLNLPSGYLTNVATDDDSDKTVSLSVDSDATPEAIEQARLIAQAAFSATLMQLKDRNPAINQYLSKI